MIAQKINQEEDEEKRGVTNLVLEKEKA